MTFLVPALLFALPLAALPVVIHLIHLYRRRQVKWAAMMFLRMAQRMNKGLSRLRQILILAFRVLAVAAIL
ncbi:MAG: BatA domain-containing protein, partial [Prosthecobacter sp.]|nr:BatA domain-containing protein [Prosthecobacter sp.]